MEARDGGNLKWQQDFLQRMQTLTQRVAALEQDLAASGAALQQARRQLAAKDAAIAKLQTQNRKLATQVKELSQALVPAAQESAAKGPTALPAFIKPNTPQRPAARPGRKAGHPAAQRPRPEKIDTHIEVPVPRDAQGCASCPKCCTQLANVAHHERIVEDILPAQRWVTCYHTTSGYCPSCRQAIESRAPEQPPLPAGKELPNEQGQLGLNALASAVLLRLQYRLPYRQITQLFVDLPGLYVSSGAVAQQMQRVARWLKGEYDRLQVLLRASAVVHMDETGWRTGGQNGWLWTMLSKQHTLYHMDKHRSQKVAGKLLGENFAGTLVSDFYGGYGKLECPKQKCLVHLLRNLKETAEKHPAFAAGSFGQRCKRLVAQMLLLKKQQATMDKARYEAKVHKLERRVLELTRDPTREPQALRLIKRLRRHRAELTHFLWHAEVEGTNNLAERALRPAVIARKIQGGSRSDAGAEATAILQSVLRTAQQQNRPLLETIKTLLTASWSGTNPGLLTDILPKQC